MFILTDAVPIPEKHFINCGQDQVKMTCVRRGLKLVKIPLQLCKAFSTFYMCFCPGFYFLYYFCVGNILKVVKCLRVLLQVS